MSDILPELNPPLDVAKFLSGEHTLKPMHHAAVGWQLFAQQLAADHVPKMADIAAWSSRITQATAHADWPAMHDAAREAMLAAWRMVQTEGATFSPEDIERVELLFESAMPNVAQVATIEHSELQVPLRPLVEYLTQWAGEESPWRDIPSPPLASTLDDLFAGVKSSPSSSTPSNFVSNIGGGGHIHDESCRHGWPFSGTSRSGHKGSGTGGYNGGHVHGIDCGRIAEGNVKKTLYWGAGSAIVAGIVYFISKYGKADTSQHINEKEKPWTNRVGDTEVSPASMPPP